LRVDKPASYPPCTMRSLKLALSNGWYILQSLWLYIMFLAWDDCPFFSWGGLISESFFFLSLRGLCRLPQSCTPNDVWLGSLLSKMCSQKPACLETFLCLESQKIANIKMWGGDHFSVYCSELRVLY
jgi:hypothetical protein